MGSLRNAFGRKSGVFACGAAVALAVLVGCNVRSSAPNSGRSVSRAGVNGFASPPRSVKFESLHYDGAAARHLETIQASHLALREPELGILRRQGFVISGAHRFPSFAHGYASIYVDDLPVYISADSILDPVHRSYDTILKTFERDLLIPELGTLLARMRAKLKAGTARELGTDAEADVDLYLAVPLSLLDGRPAPPVAGANATVVDGYAARAQQAAGVGSATLFGGERMVDFSQYKPRGHYAGDAALERFFKAMMWFGREDVQITDGKELRRRAVRGALAMRSLLDGEDMKRWEAIDRALDAFVGKRDSMSFAEVDRIESDLGAPNLVATLSSSDDRWLRTLEHGNYGAQRIGSGLRAEGEAIPRSFSPFGQRYIVDSEVFSKLVYDKLPAGGGHPRLMPNPLDVAYTVFGNAHAKDLLGGEMKQYKALDSGLESARSDVDALDASEWQRNLYNTWLFALRSLSPGAEGAGALPAVARTEPWARRILNTQLASWAELRHNTILYAKQSYTAMIACEYPDAYVDPYPRFYAALGQYAHRGKEVARAFERGDSGARASTSDLAARIREYFQNLDDVVTVLADMADRELRGEAFTDAQMKFVNQAVHIKTVTESAGCGASTTRYLEGWYSKLFYDPDDSLKYAPTIADVHTQPTDESGNMVGKVLHVGTGKPQLMAVTVDTCKGPSTYVGLAYSYYEETTQNFNRLTDKEWERVVDSRTPPGWLSEIVAGAPRTSTR